MTLNKVNCQVSKSEKGNVYITHPNFKTRLRLYATVEELKSDPDWRSKVTIREGNNNSFFATLSQTVLEELDI